MKTKKYMKNWAMVLSLLLVGLTNVSAEPENATLPIAGKEVSFETNMGTQAITYYGTDNAGRYTLKLTRAKNGQVSEIQGQYQVSEDNKWWTVQHENNNGTFYLRFEITQMLPNGFSAKGNVLDADRHPALHGDSPFDFEFLNSKQN